MATDSPFGDWMGRAPHRTSPNVVSVGDLCDRPVMTNFGAVEFDPPMRVEGVIRCASVSPWPPIWEPVEEEFYGS